MPKQQTIRQWSEARKRRVFRRRAATLTKDLMRDVSTNDDAVDFSHREMRILSRQIARDLLAALQSPEFIGKARGYGEDCSLNFEDVLPKVEEHVLSSIGIDAE